MNEHEYHDAMVRGKEASHIMEHPMVRDALAGLRADVYEKMEATKWSDSAAREALYHQLKAIANFEAQFQFHIEEGRVALSWLDKKRAEAAVKRSRHKA